MVRQSAVLSTLLAAAVAACAHNPSPSTAPAPTGPPQAMQPAGPSGSNGSNGGYGSNGATAAAPAPAAAAIPDANAADVSGTWIGTAELPGQTVGVTVTIEKGPNGYSGSAIPDGETQSAPLSTLHLDGTHLVMTFTAPDGPATFDMTLSGDRQAMSGNVAYQGQQIAFSARKRH